MTDVRVTISGSYTRHLDRIMLVRRQLKAQGVEVLRPSSDNIVPSIDGIVRIEGDPPDRESIQRAQLEAIRRSHFVYVVNPGGYLGSSVMMECGFAYGLGIPLVFQEPPFEPAASLLTAMHGSPLAALARYGHLAELMPTDREAIRVFFWEMEFLKLRNQFDGELLSVRLTNEGSELSHVLDNGSKHLLAHNIDNRRSLLEIEPKCAICTAARGVLEEHQERYWRAGGHKHD